MTGRLGWHTSQHPTPYGGCHPLSVLSQHWRKKAVEEHFYFSTSWMNLCTDSHFVAGSLWANALRSAMRTSSSRAGQCEVAWGPGTKRAQGRHEWGGGGGGEKGAAAAIENRSENFRDFFPHRKTIHEFSVLWLFFSSPTSSVGGFFLRVVWQEGRGTPAPWGIFILQVSLFLSLPSFCFPGSRSTHTHAHI
jgi:hypothetical protein